MTRLFDFGPGLGTVANLVEITVGASGLALETTIIRSTPFSLKAGSLSSGTSKRAEHRFVAAVADGPFFGRTYLYPAVLPTAENTICGFLREAGPDRCVWITLDNAGVLRLHDEDGVIGSASPALTLGTFENRIEMEYDRTAAAGSHVVRAKLNGVVFAESTTRSLSFACEKFTVGANLGLETQTQGEWYFADGAINDSTGTVENSFPGSGKLSYLFPIGPGDAAATLGTFADIDEVPPDDATSIIEIDTAIAANYEFQKCADVGIPANAIIKLLHVGTRGRAETAAQAGWTPQLKSQPGGTTFDGTAATKDDTTFSSNGDAIPRNFKLTSYTDPQTGLPWTPARIDTLRAGVNVTDATPNLHFTIIYVVVEWSPGPVDTFMTVQFRAAA